jgi:hypothetical protein
MNEAPTCSADVRIAGLNFARYRQCSRKATTVDEAGLPVCKQHSPQAKTNRATKARTNYETTQRKKMGLHLAYIHAKTKYKKGLKA